MSKKDFVMIGTAVLVCKRFRNLKTCCERNAYFTAMISSQANYIGIFSYPLSWFSREANIPEAELKTVIELLEAAELIEYDWQEEYIRLKDWFYSSNITVSDTTVRGAARDFLKAGVPKTEHVAKSISEFVVASLVGVKGYSSKSVHGPIVVEELRKFLIEAASTFPDLDRLLIEEMERCGATVKNDFDTVYLGLVESESTAARPILPVSAARPQGGLEAPTRYNTKLDFTKTKLDTRPACAKINERPFSITKSEMRPMQSTLDSALVLAAKKKKSW